ncbi:MAG: alpha/beta hydrolase [Nitrosomonas sp.]|nr:alpha/beta hydrolase [Nitrosomonas sp.]
MVKPILCWPLQPLSYLLLSDRWAPTHLEALEPAPVLVIHGQQDNVVGPQFGEAIYEKLANPNRYGAFPMEAILIFSGSMKKISRSVSQFPHVRMYAQIAGHRD